ncbi:MAG: phage portal protein [Candidatus Rokuibacteriota bacterium]|nr:MAG: phage portal protein [Candidatus Rokubacteria bacterium]
MNLNPFAAVTRLFRRSPAAVAPRAELVTQVRNTATAPFEAAGHGRRARGWHAPTLGPNDAMLFSQSTLRDRSRSATRNNGFANDIIDKLVTNLVGTGLIPKSLAPDAAFRDRVHELWGQWVDEADTSGVLDLYGLMSQAVRCWLEAGECFVRIRPRLLSDGLVVPLQLQILEPEFCPSTYNTTYSFYQQQPAFFSDLHRSSLVAIPARNINGQLLVTHVYEPVRPNQLRGLPHLTQALIKLYDVDRFDDATLLRAQLQNLFAWFVKRPATLADASGNHLDPLTGQAVNLDDNGLPILALEPGIFQELGPGEDVTFNQPPDAGASYGEFMRVQLMGAATAAGVPYELLTGDLREVSDRALRVILNEFRRKIEQRQHQIIAFQFCRPVWASWLAQAFASGALPIPPGYEKNPKAWERVEWVPPRFGYLHPVQDSEAERALVRSGFKSRSQVVTELGYNIEQLDREIAADNARADELGLVFDSDPRKTGPSQTTAVPTTAVPDATPTTTPSGASAQVIRRVIRDPNGLISAIIEDHVPGVRAPKVRVTNNIQTPKPEVRIVEE